MTSDDRFHVLIAGGGVAALEGALALREAAGDDIDLTLVAPTDEFRFRPLAVTEPFGAGHAGRMPLADFAGDVNARLLNAAVEAVDPQAREVTLSNGDRVAYDALLLATGARPRAELAGALTWFDGTDPAELGGILRDIEEGYSRRVTFVVPSGSGWPLPVYELALMTARQVHGMGIDDVQIALITPESAPLALFGPRASTAVEQELTAAGIVLRTDVRATADPDRRGTLVLRPGGERLSGGRIVTLPRLEGPHLAGVPANRDGFIPTDPHARVVGAEWIWAAGDGTAFPVKQGGVAAQQAAVAAQDIAALAGRGTPPAPFDPVLRGTLLTGAEPWHFRWAAGHGDGQVARRPLWWPPTKVAGGRLSTYLAAHPQVPAGIAVEVPVARTADPAPAP
jgi:sulfide:quinone oxidoreductase